MPPEILSIFSPLPPEENGIADYTFHLLRPLSRLFECTAFVEDQNAIAPPDVMLCDALQAFRYLGPGSKILHQLGNNPGHIFVLEALRNWGGVTTLHDQNLHYLYEVAGTSKAAMLPRMTATSFDLGLTYARHWREENLKSLSNYVLFDMLDETLAASDAVIVHSEFAKRRLVLLYGQERCQRVEVIPHLALPFNPGDPREAVARLRIPAGVPLIVTSGFATNAKRFDWLIAALHEVAGRGVEFFWVHAGKEKPEEFGLSEFLERYPLVKDRSRITGYLTEDDLNSYISACDILVNLRFPSVGESSGTLARAMAVGKCCVVSNTAAYADLPKDAVAHAPVFNSVPHLVGILQSLLVQPALRAAFGEGAKRLVQQEWAPDRVAAKYANVLQDTTFDRKFGAGARLLSATARVMRFPIGAQTQQADVVKALGPFAGPIELEFEVESLEKLAEYSLSTPRLLAKFLPPAFQIDSITLQREAAAPTASGRRQKVNEPNVVVRVKGSLP
jgi:glycosyltransferase involved in cell wall biosynthesis